MDEKRVRSGVVRRAVPEAEEVEVEGCGWRDSVVVMIVIVGGVNVSFKGVV